MFIVKRDGLIYEVTSPEVFCTKSMYLIYKLNLICGFDYVNPDENDLQGWVDSSRFTEHVQSEDVLVLSDESLTDRLKEENFEIIKNLPKIHTIKKEV